MEELKTARAQLVHARIAPRKVQIVCDMIRGKDTKIADASGDPCPAAQPPVGLHRRVAAHPVHGHGHPLPRPRLG